MSQQRRPRPIVLVAIGLMVVVCGALILNSYAQEVDAHRATLNQAYYAEVSTSTIPQSLTGVWSQGHIDLPILVYHIVRPSYPDDSPGVRSLAQTPEVFDAQLQHLSDAGYHVISFADLENYFNHGAPLPTKPIIISFDDGWRNQFQYAFPILEKHHMTATFFVFTNPIGKRGFMTWDNLKTLRDAGMTIGSHSLSHPYLTKMEDPASIKNEIVQSKQVLEKNLGVPVNQFAYPFGQYNDSIVAAVAAAGYTSARGDYYSGEQSPSVLYRLSAMNVPTTLSQFVHRFP